MTDEELIVIQNEIRNMRNEVVLHYQEISRLRIENVAISEEVRGLRNHVVAMVNQTPTKG